MKVFVVGIALACAGTGLTQWALTHQHVQVQAAPSSIPDKPDADTSGQSDSVYVPKSIPFDAATYNMNSLPYKSIDGPDPAKLWDESDGSTARSAEGWDGVSPSPSATAKAGSKSSAGKLSAGSTSVPKASKPGSGVGLSKPQAPAAIRIAQGTKGGLATPQTLSQGPSVKPRKVPIY